MLKLTHNVLMVGAFASESGDGGCVRFFDMEALKTTGKYDGPLVFAASLVDQRFLNLFCFSPLLYQTTQRAKMDVEDVSMKLAVAVNQELVPKALAEEICNQLNDLVVAIEVAQQVAREGMVIEEARQEPKS